jgi:hypothetical protein
LIKYQTIYDNSFNIYRLLQTLNKAWSRQLN